LKSEHQYHRSCPVHFASGQDALSISSEVLDRPNHLSDDGVSRFLITHLDAEIESIGTEIPVQALVEREISRSLSAGIPSQNVGAWYLYWTDIIDAGDSSGRTSWSSWHFDMCVVQRSP
jgi:hypothetical protein